MITVRFPNGLSVQYKDAVDYIEETDRTFLLVDSFAKPIAIVPDRCIIELQRASAIDKYRED